MEVGGDLGAGVAAADQTTRCPAKGLRSQLELDTARTSREQDLSVAGEEWRAFDGMRMAWTRSSWGD